MKKALLYIIIFASICYLTNYSIDYTIGKQVKNQSPYYLSFASIGANSLESHLDCWAKIRTTSSAEEMRSYLHDILECLSIEMAEEALLLQEEENRRALSYEITVDSESERIYIDIEADDNINTTYFIVSVDSSVNKGLNYLEKELDKLIGLKWTCYYRYTGTLDYMVDRASRRQILDVMLRNLQCSEIEVFDDNRTLSCTAFSPLVEGYSDSVTVGESQCNVQLAIQVDESAAKTNVIIGSPLILGNY